MRDIHTKCGTVESQVSTEMQICLQYKVKQSTTSVNKHQLQ